MTSTLSGLLLGIATAVVVAALYGDELNQRVRALLEPVQLSVTHSARAPEPSLPTEAVVEEPAPEPVAKGTEQVAEASEPPSPEQDDGLASRWAEFAAVADQLQPVGDFRWRECFTRAAASYGVSEPLLLAIASGESNFDPAARSEKDAIGLMQIRWPDTSRHLGVLREADLYDPCTNVAAGARYLAELSDRFDHDLHRVVAAYNYGPQRIETDVLPEGARWYSQYIYQHLQRVLGAPHIPTSELIPPVNGTGGGFQVLVRFNQPYRARDFMAFMDTQIPGLELAHRSEALGQHEVVLLYKDETERRRALDSIRDAGLFPMTRATDIPKAL